MIWYLLMISVLPFRTVYAIYFHSRALSHWNEIMRTTINKISQKFQYRRWYFILMWAFSRLMLRIPLPASSPPCDSKTVFPDFLFFDDIYRLLIYWPYFAYSFLPFSAKSIDTISAHDCRAGFLSDINERSFRHSEFTYRCASTAAAMAFWYISSTWCAPSRVANFNILIYFIIFGKMR